MVDENYVATELAVAVVVVAAVHIFIDK